MSTISIGGRLFEVKAGIAISEAAASCGILPDAYIFMVGGKPVPMDSTVPEDAEVRAIRVASGGRSLAGYLRQGVEVESALLRRIRELVHVPEERLADGGSLEPSLR